MLLRSHIHSITRSLAAVAVPSCLFIGLASLSGCTATASNSSDESPDGQSGEGTGGARGRDTDNVDSNCTPQAGPGVLRRLTNPEYVATLGELFGDLGFPGGQPLTGNTADGAYSTRASGLRVRDLTAQAIANHATSVAEWAVENHPTKITTCTELSEGCALETVHGFGRRAFQAPLTDAQAARYVPVFMAGETFDEALSMTVSTMIQSPYFLYRREIGEGGGATSPLSDYELGSALAYFLTDAPPDAELTETIDAGGLRDEAQWQAQVERLLNTPAVEEKLISFVVEWLALDEVLTRTKTEADFEVAESLRVSMMGEVEAFVRHVVQTGGGVSDLLAADTVFINAELAEHYGMAGPVGPAFEEVTAETRTGGILGTGAYLLSHSTVDSSSPTLRGVFIRKQLLCLEVPPPPPSADTDLPPLTGPITTRERYSEHLSDTVCATCHELTDNFGYAFESYDGLGRYRTQEQGFDVDSSGTTMGLTAGDVHFDDSHELVDVLATDEQVERCFHQHLTEYVLGQADWDNLCSTNAAMRGSRKAGGTLKESLRAILSLPHLEARIAQGAL